MTLSENDTDLLLPQAGLVMSGLSGWIGVDLDGTLAYYDRWNGSIGMPIMPMVERVRAWLAKGIDVRIVTARVSGCDEETADQEKQIKAWCKEHIGFELPVTCKKDFAMIELWDDRAVRVVVNTGQPCCSQFEDLK